MSASAALEACRVAFDECEAQVKAWVCTDWEAARRAASARDQRPLALGGLVLGVKDVFATAAFPTAYGSPIYAGNRPREDAAVVAVLQAAGAVVLGKTVTAEFATRHPGPTTNPHRATHTPGGSSMGSAAAVAAGMAHLALGTQTLGSVIRPASYCGVYGFKPTHGSVPVAGLKLVAPSLDTVGWFARDVDTLDRARVALTARAPRPASFRPRLALMRTDQWGAVGPDSATAVQRALSMAADHGAALRERPDPARCDGLVEGAGVVMAYEAARSLSFEYESFSERLSPELTVLLEQGRATDPLAYDAVRHAARAAADDLEAIFGDCDVLVSAAALGEAPEGLGSTGDPRCCALWTLLGFPTLSVPGLVGASGLPVGIQMIARPGADGALLAAGEWLGNLLGSATEAPPAVGP